MNVGEWGFTPLETNVLFHNGELFQEKRTMNICSGALRVILKVYVESIIGCFSKS